MELDVDVDMRNVNCAHSVDINVSCNNDRGNDGDVDYSDNGSEVDEEILLDDNDASD